MPQNPYGYRPPTSNVPPAGATSVDAGTSVAAPNSGADLGNPYGAYGATGADVTHDVNLDTSMGGRAALANAFAEQSPTIFGLPTGLPSNPVQAFPSIAGLFNPIAGLAARLGMKGVNMANNSTLRGMVDQPEFPEEIPGNLQSPNPYGPELPNFAQLNAIGMAPSAAGGYGTIGGAPMGMGQFGGIAATGTSAPSDYSGTGLTSSSGLGPSGPSGPAGSGPATGVDFGDVGPQGDMGATGPVGESSGGGGGGGGGGSVICTALYSKGLIDTDTLAANTRFRFVMGPVAYRGYLAWAQPLVRWATKTPRRFKLVYWLTKPLINAFTKQIRYIIYGTNPSLLGWGLLRVGIPACRLLGSMLSGTQEHQGVSGSQQTR